MNFPLDVIDIGSAESLWSILTGFRVKNGVEVNVKIHAVDYISNGDKNANNFEAFSQIIGFNFN